MAKKSKKSEDVMPDEEDWKAESDMRTLIDAEKIKRDKPRLKRALAKAKEQRDSAQKIINQGSKKES